jgi:peptidoglycan biosynthesis protein MviN/MurJ (putative lipid II flippase)
MAITFAVLNPLGNLLLIPLIQQDGAALVSSLTELGWLVWLLRSIPAEVFPRESARLAAKAVVAAGAAAIVGLVIADRGLVLAVPITLAAYAAGLIALGALGPSELAALRGLTRAEPTTEYPQPAAIAAGKEVA